MDKYVLPKIAIRKLDPSSKKLKADARSREDVVSSSVKEQEKKKMKETEVGSFHLDFGEFPLDASLLGNDPYAKTVASKLIFPADAERFGNTSDALLAVHLTTASMVANQLSCEAARRFETREKKYEEENRRLMREVLELESKLLDTTALNELTMGELDLSRAKVSVLEGAARKKDGNDLQLKEDRIQELELELKSKQEAAEKEKEEAVDAAYQHFIKDLAKRDEFLATKYFTQGRNSAKIQVQERPELEFSEVDLDADDCQSDVELKEQQRIGKKIEEKKKPLEAIHADRPHKLLVKSSSNVNGRPVRERKSVERLVATIENDSSRELRIRKGRGTALKDIPNVSYKISRVKNDDIFKLLHTVLYGKRGKAIEVKDKVYEFSGFLWRGDEDTQRSKIKGKLDRFPKERLLEFCDLLDIPISKASTIRKEDVLLKLVEFLEAPHATTNILLTEKEQLQRKVVEASNEEEKSPVGTDDETDKDDEMEEEENEKGVQEQSEDETHSSGEENENESEEGSTEESKKRKRSSSSGKKNSVAKKKTQKVKNAKEEKSEKKISKGKEAPIETELRDKICEIMAEFDLSTVTNKDVFNRIGTKYTKSLTSSYIKLIIEEEYTKLAEEADEEEAHGESDGENDEI